MHRGNSFLSLAQIDNLHQELNGNSLFMHFCDLNHEVTRMQQEKQQQHR